MAQIQRTTVIPEAGGALRVEISIADSVDIENAREAMTLVAVVQGSENPSLSEVQKLALRRARELVDESIRALDPRR